MQNNNAPPLPKLPANISALPQPSVTEDLPAFAPLWFYYFTEEDRNIGPISLIDFEKEKDQVDGLTWVWRYGFPCWVRLGDCSQLRDFIKSLVGDGIADDSIGMGIDETLLTSTIDDEQSVKKDAGLAENTPTEVDLEKKLRNIQSRKDYRMRQKVKKMEQNNSSVYVAGLNIDDVTLENLIDLFKGAGQIMLNTDMQPIVKLYRNATDGTLKGDGLITYKDPTSKDLAIKYYDGRTFLGNKLTVTAAQFNYAEQANRKRGPVSKKELFEAKKKRQLVDAELIRRQADGDELSALFLESTAGQKTFGVVIKPLWLPENAAEWNFDDPVYDLISETLLLNLSRKSSTKDLIWGAWSDIKKISVIKGHRDGVAIVYLRDRHSAEALIDAVTNSELPWGPMNIKQDKVECPLPSKEFENKKFDIETIRAEHAIVTAYAHITGTDYSSQIVNERSISSISLNSQWNTFIHNCRDSLLPRKGGQLIPFAQCTQEDGIDPLIRLQRRLYCYNNSIPLLPVVLQTTNISPEKRIAPDTITDASHQDRTIQTESKLQLASLNSITVQLPTIEEQLAAISLPTTNSIDDIKSSAGVGNIGLNLREEDMNNLNGFMDAVEEESSDEEFRIVKE